MFPNPPRLFVNPSSPPGIPICDRASAASPILLSIAGDANTPGNPPKAANPPRPAIPPKPIPPIAPLSYR